MVRGNFSNKKLRKNITADLPVITKTAWRELKEAQKREQEEIVEKKEANRVARLQKKLEEERQKEEKSAKKLEKIPKQTKKKGASEPTIKKKQIRRKIPSPMPSSPTSSEIDDELEGNEKLLGDICIGSWVLVLYNGKQYPGRVISINDGDYEVKTLMEVQYLGKQMYKWPSRDIIFYSPTAIVKILQSLKISKGHGRGARLYEFKL